MATDRQIQANRLNALMGGVKTAKGKAVSSLNARKHGIFASALTTADEKELHSRQRELVKSIQPVGAIEEMLVEKLALTYLRLQRCAHAEAQYHAKTWEEPDTRYVELTFDEKRQRRRGEKVVRFHADQFEKTVQLFSIYDMRLTNQMLKLIHEIERLQRRRAGEDVTAPITGEVTVDVETAGAGEQGDIADCGLQNADRTNEKTNPIQQAGIGGSRLGIGGQSKAGQNDKTNPILEDEGMVESIAGGLTNVPGESPGAQTRLAL